MIYRNTVTKALLDIS